jgi:hypothetical protein
VTSEDDTERYAHSVTAVFGDARQVDSEGWPILDQKAEIQPGWDAPSLTELLATEPPVTPVNSQLDPLEGFVFPKRRRRNPLPKMLLVLFLATAVASAFYATHKTGVPIAAVHPKDCLELPTASDLPGKRLTRFNRVPCNTPHNAEVFASKIFNTDAPFPGEEALSAAAAKSCEESVPTAIRLHPEASTWSVRYFAPLSASTYRQGETATLLCVVSFPRDMTA